MFLIVFTDFLPLFLIIIITIPKIMILGIVKSKGVSYQLRLPFILFRKTPGTWGGNIGE